MRRGTLKVLTPVQLFEKKWLTEIKATAKGRQTIIIYIRLYIYCLITAIFKSLLNLVQGFANFVKFETIFLIVKCFLRILYMWIYAYGFSQNYFWKQTLISDDFVYNILVIAKKYNKNTSPSNPNKTAMKINSQFLFGSPSPLTNNYTSRTTSPSLNSILKKKLKQQMKAMGLSLIQNILELSYFFFLFSLKFSQQLLFLRLELIDCLVAVDTELGILFKIQAFQFLYYFQTSSIIMLLSIIYSEFHAKSGYSIML